MHIISLILISLLLIPTAQGQLGGEKKKKGQDQYYKYEREDVNLYRDRVDFRLPEPKIEQEDPDSEEGYTQPVSLEYLFQGDKKVHIDSDYRLNQLISVHQDIGKKTIHVDGYRIQIYAG